MTTATNTFTSSLPRSAKLVAAALLGLFAATAAQADGRESRFRGNDGHSQRYDQRLHDNRRYDNGRPNAYRDSDGSRGRDDRAERRDDRRNYRNGYQQGYRQGARDDDRNDRRDWRRNYSPVYVAPRWHRGDRLPSHYYDSRYVVSNYGDYRLHAPYRGHHWVRVDNDALLVAFGTGVIAGLVIDAFN